MATERYGAEGTFISPGTWRGPQFAAEWRLYFTDEARYPIMIKDLHQTIGSYTNWTIEVYDNHGQHYSHMVQQREPSGGSYFTNSFARQNHVFQCVADKEFGNPLTPKLIDLVKANSVQTCIKAMAAATLDTEKVVAERDARTAEVEALKAELARVAAERDAIRAELATKAATVEKTEKTAFMVASTVVVGILGLLASSGTTSAQSIMPPLFPMLSSPADLD